MMNYKGYIGQVEYDDVNRVFTGSVINTQTVITFHGSSVDELEREFQTSVDDYLDWCKQEGIEPERLYSGKFVVRIQPELHKKAAIAAKKLGMSLNAFIEKSTEDELIVIAEG